MTDVPRKRSPRKRQLAATGARSLEPKSESSKASRKRRSPKDDVSTWIVTDDWPDKVPVTEEEVQVFMAWFGDVFDEIFGPEDTPAKPEP